MSKIPYLLRRGNTFYFRIAVPAELREKFQCREVIQSLKTERRAEAIPLALGLAAEVIKLFNNAKTMTDMIHKRQLAALREKQKIREMLHQEELEQKELDHLTELRRIKAEVGLKAENNLLKEMIASGGITSGAVQTSTVTPEATSDSPLLSAVIDDFLKQYDKGKKGMLKKHEANLPVMLGLLGDKRVNQIRHTDLTRFAIELCKLPVDRASPKFKDMTFKQMIAANDGECLHKKTFQNYKSSVKAVIVWARGLYEGAFENVNIAEIEYKGGRVESEAGQRSFDDAELEALFNGKAMQECCVDGKQVHKFWLPAIGLYSGMRVNEICQLNPATDIKQDDNGIWYFWVTEETESAVDVMKSVKTDAGKRVIPMHSNLIKCGLLDYVETVKNSGYKSLFPQWKAKDGKAGDNAGREFRRFIDSIGLRDETKNKKLVGMHAFRKTFLTKAYKSGIIFDVLAIVGHENDIRDENGKCLPQQTMLYIDDEALEAPLSEKKVTIEKIIFDVDLPKPAKPVFRK
jgi:integrase